MTGDPIHPEFFDIPSNKFYPPHIDKSQSLLRTGLLTSRLSRRIKSKKAIILEAQAGQGKTTLISQFLDYNRFEYVWYQIGQEDNDPVLLLSSLLANFNLKYSDFHSPQLSLILQEGEIGSLDLKRCANLLLNDLNSYLRHDLFVVFDDLHLISGTPLTNTVLEHLIDTSPPKLHFVLSSRQPLEIKSKTLRDSNKISFFNTDDLALDNREIEELFTSVFDRQITRQDAIDIHHMTKGWIMGIVLASHPMTGKPRFWQQPANGSISLVHSDQEHMLDYFQDEIFDKIPEKLHIPFLRLSFIAQIPVELAEMITGIDKFGNILSDMARENFFVYRLDDNKSVFRFHHFFQEFLQIRARHELSESEIRAIHTHEAEFYLDREMVERALTSYKNAGDYHSMEQILQAKGMELVAKNRTFTILPLLDSIPKEALFQHGWLTFYSGMLRIDYAPKSTLTYYERAKEIFVKNKDQTGELLCLSQMIYFHFVISGKYHTGAGLLPRAAALLRQNMTKLPDTVKIEAARNLASGYCFFNSDMDEARSHINMACILATRKKSRNFIASSRFIKGYIELLCGNRSKYLREAEKCYSLIHDPLVSTSNKLAIHIMYLCYFSMVGDFLNFKTHKQVIQKSIAPTVTKQTIAAPYFFVWGASGYISMGETKKAIDLLARGFDSTSTASTNHMRSQLLQWQAYGVALLGDRESALTHIHEAARLREDAGGTYFYAFHNVLKGGVYTRVGEYDLARDALNLATRQAEAAPSTFLTICALFQRSYYNLVDHDPESALDDLDRGLSLMKNNGYTHFWGWEPVMMGRLLATAVRFNIEKGFAQLLARQRLKVNFNDHGESITLLNFSLLDRFQINLGEIVVCRAKDLTPSQRELLGLLVTAKGQRISQERVQLELWPDNRPDNARKSLDTLLTRLRKELSKTRGLQARDYIFLQKGILCLDNYQMDSLQFAEAARQGMEHCKNSDWWQAGNAYTQALYFWRGALPEDTFKSEQVLDCSDQLVNTLINFTSTWAGHMAENGRTDEAIALIEQVLQLNRIEEQLVTLLYALHLRTNNPIKARETLDRYKVALKKIEYSYGEIEGFLQDVIATALKINTRDQKDTNLQFELHN